MPRLGRRLRELGTLSPAERRLVWVLALVAGVGRLVPPPPAIDTAAHAPPAVLSAPPPTKAERLAALTRPIALNSASEEELQILPGVGPTIAERIVALRRARGGLGRVEELLEVPGIGPKRLARIAPHVALAGPARGALQPDGIEPISMGVEVLIPP